MESNEPLTLRRFLARQYQIAIDACDEELDTLLDTVFVLQGYQTCVLPSIDPHWSFHQLLERCQLHLLKNGVKTNSLTDGYFVGKGTKLHTPACLGITNSLRSHAWRKLHWLLGCKNMAEVLLSHSAFKSTGSGFVQLFGTSLKRSFTPPKPRPKLFSLNKCLYRSDHQTERWNPVPMTKLSFAQTVFKDEYQGMKDISKVPKKLIPFVKLAGITIDNHKKCRYLPIFDQLCPEPTEQDFLQKAVKKHDVIKFCSVIFEKVLPFEMYGSRNNKSTIMSNMSSIISGNKGFEIDIEGCMSGMTTNEVCWLGKSYLGSRNKQDALKRQKLLREFVVWIFSFFLPRLIMSFFHVTHISSSTNLLFFRHSSWRAISKSFINDYRSNHLLPEQEALSITQSEKSVALRCNFRVMPKKNNDFRVINVPLRGKDPTEDREFTAHVLNELRPAKRVVNRLRLSQKTFFPQLTSINQLPLHISRFKRSLLSKNGVIPTLFFLKFDAKACYDTLPQSKIMECVESLVDRNVSYSISTITNIDLQEKGSMNISRHLDHLGNLKRIEQLSHHNSVLHGNPRCDTLNGIEIIEIVKIHLETSTTQLGGSRFARKDGVFQGLHLSSLFCDLVYEKLILDRLFFLSGDHSLVLRIADDFLVISCVPDLILRARELVADGMHEYGLQINKLKTATNFDSQRNINYDSSITFCGFNIDAAHLEVVKVFDGPYSPNVRSGREAINKLLNILKVRSSYNTLSTSDNEKSSILKQTHILIKNIAVSYINITRRLDVLQDEFIAFISEILDQITEKVGKADREAYADIRRVTLESFLNELVKKNSKHRASIEYIQGQLYRSKYER